jgi:hypothetical protein
VKVLDFGLAKMLEAGAAGGEEGQEAQEASRGLTMSPTLSVHATYADVILGTSAYLTRARA